MSTLNPTVAGTATTAPRSSGSGPRKTREGQRKKVSNVVYSVIAVIVFAASAFPVYWMINSSFLPTNMIRSTDLTFFPGSSFTIDNYKSAIFGQERAPFLPALGNSVMVTFFVLIVSMVLAFLASLAVTRFNFKGRKAFIIAILAVQMIPGEAMMISIFRIIDGWQLLNSIIGLGIVYLSGVLPFTIWTLRGFVAGVPAELEEAAMIDGCSRADRKSTRLNSSHTMTSRMPSSA